MNQKLELDFNIFFPGWHSFRFPKFESMLRSLVPRLPGLVLCTVPTSLTEKIVNADLSQYFTGGPPDANVSYGYWGNLKYSVNSAKKLLADLQRQNEIARKVAKESKIPLLDFYNRFNACDFPNFRVDFFDAGHPRPKSYAKWHEFIGEELKNVLV